MNRETTIWIKPENRDSGNFSIAPAVLDDLCDNYDIAHLQVIGEELPFKTIQVSKITDQCVRRILVEKKPINLVCHIGLDV